MNGRKYGRTVAAVLFLFPSLRHSTLNGTHNFDPFFVLDEILFGIFIVVQAAAEGTRLR